MHDHLPVLAVAGGAGLWGVCEGEARRVDNTIAAYEGHGHLEEVGSEL